jgi:hypothetical protein
MGTRVTVTVTMVFSRVGLPCGTDGSWTLCPVQSRTASLCESPAQLHCSRWRLIQLSPRFTSAPLMRGRAGPPRERSMFRHRTKRRWLF